MAIEQQTLVEAATEEQPEQPTPPSKAEVLEQILNVPNLQFVPWEKLMNNGVVVDLDLKRHRFTKQLHFHDLGLHFTDPALAEKMGDLFTLGTKNLLPGGRNRTKQPPKAEGDQENAAPKEEMYRATINNIDYKARYALERYSVPTVWGRFVPYTSFDVWYAETLKLEQEYYAARDLIIRDWKMIRKKMILDYTEAARRAYFVLKQTSPDGLTDEEKEREALYLIGVRREIRKLLPTPEEIYTSFVFQINMTYIDLPRLVGTENDEEQLPAAPGSRIETTEIEDVTADEAERVRLLAAGAYKRQQMIEKMNREVVARAKKRKEEQIDAFLITAIGAVRGLLYEGCTGALAAIRRNDRMPSKTPEKLRNLVETIGALNFYNDQEVDRAVQLIAGFTEMSAEGRKATLPKIEATLAQIAITMRDTLIPLGHQFRETRGEEKEGREALKNRIEAGIPALPTTREVREAREGLGFTVPAWTSEQREKRETRREREW